MSYRRAAGVAAAFLMIQLVLAGSELVCPQHDRESASSVSSSAGTESHEAHHHTGGSGSQQNTVPSEHHSLPDCCPAMTACSNHVAIQSGDEILSAGFARLSAPVYVATLFHSRVESPDPPPPKA